MISSLLQVMNVFWNVSQISIPVQYLEVEADNTDCTKYPFTGHFKMVNSEYILKTSWWLLEGKGSGDG